jgi:serine protease Do
MSTFKARFAAILSVIFILVTVFAFIPTEAIGKSTIIAKPKVTLVTKPLKEYKFGETIRTTVYSPNYSGKVQYRAFLTNLSTKKTTELWTNPKTNYYYTGKILTGKQKFTFLWPVKNLPTGTYTLTILVRRYGVKSSYESYVRTSNFTIKGTNFSAITKSKALTTAEIVKNYDKSIVMIEALDAYNEPLAFGSGIAAGNGLFITNYHVLDVEGVKKYRIIASDNKVYEVDGIIKYDEIRDLAIIKSKQLFKITPVKIGTYKSVAKGEKIVTIGNPNGLQNTVSEGIVSGLHNLNEYALNLIQITAPITYGSSGGALFNMRGEAIGVTTMGSDEGNLNFAVAMDHTHAWLNQFEGMDFAKIAVSKKYLDTGVANPSDSETPSTTAPSSTNTVLGNADYLMDLNFQVTDSVMDTNKPVLYITDRVNQKLYSVNYKTKQIQELSFNLPPESIDYFNGKVYVSLLKQEHTYDPDDENQKGAFAIIDTSTMKILDIVDVNIDPFDIVVDKDGYIYIISGSGQWTFMKSYDGVTRQQVGVAQQVRHQSYLSYNQMLNKIYIIDTDSSPRGIETKSVNQGKFTSSYDSPYHGTYALDTNIKISPDGKYIFNGSGNVFTSAQMSQDDMRYVGNIKKAFKDITFEGSSKFYTGGIENAVYKHDYESFSQEGLYKTSGISKHLFYKDNEVISISKVTKLGKNNAFGIEIIKTGKPTQPSSSTTEETSNNTPSTSYTSHKADFLMNMGFQIADMVMEPNKPVIYALDRADKTLYRVNYETKEVNKVSFDLSPESIAIADGNVYVALAKQEHSDFLWTEDQKGAFAIVDATSMAIKEIVDINIDPYDIVASTDGHIYLTSGSGQWTKIVGYNIATKQEVTSRSVYNKSYAIYSPWHNKIYTIDGGNIEASNLENGKFIGSYRAPYYSGYSFDRNYKFSPDGKYIFNTSGAILSSAKDSASDMKIAGRLDTGYIDVTFDGKGRFYTSQSVNRIYVYDYETFKGIDSFAINGTVQYLEFRNGKLLAIIKTRKFEGSEIYNYSIYTIDV